LRTYKLRNILFF